MVATQGFESEDEQAAEHSLRPRHNGGIGGTLLGPGSVLEGRYRIERVLGEGGMGIVYRASHVNLKRSVAIKLLHPDVAKDPVIFDRFLQEAQSASAIGHRNIVDIRDFGVLEDGTSYIVMEYLEGRDLHDLIQTFGPVPPSMVVALGAQIAEGLSAAHAAGIIHRDLKPDNIFLVQSQDPVPLIKILDFGIAKAASSSSRLTRSGQVFGTPQYMSPEQCSGQHVDERSDIYALGTVLYEMLVGAPAFKADTLMGVLTKQMYEKPRPPSTYSLPFRLPKALESLIMKCLAKRPARRYPSMTAVLDALSDIEFRNEDVASIHPEVSWRPQPSSIVPSTASDEPSRAEYTGNGLVVPELQALGEHGSSEPDSAARSASAADQESDIPVELPMLWFSGTSFRWMRRSRRIGIIITLILVLIFIALASDWGAEDSHNTPLGDATDPAATHRSSANTALETPENRPTQDANAQINRAIDAPMPPEQLTGTQDAGDIDSQDAGASASKENTSRKRAPQQAPVPSARPDDISGPAGRARRPAKDQASEAKAPRLGGLRLVDPWE